jgi:hypothetical protein
MTQRTAHRALASLRRSGEREREREKRAQSRVRGVGAGAGDGHYTTIQWRSREISSGRSKHGRVFARVDGGEGLEGDYCSALWITAVDLLYCTVIYYTLLRFTVMILYVVWMWFGWFGWFDPPFSLKVS